MAPRPDRRADGRARRSVASRSSHAVWQAPADRPDPVALLETQGATRVPELVPIRHARMAASPFAFYRGAAAVMARDLATTPQTGMRVSSPVTIAGSADVFEATVNIRVLDANGEVIAESFAMATCGTGCRGDFSTQVDVPIDAEQPGTIQVFEYSAKDGSMINMVEIPVTLVPDVASATSGLEGSWFDASGQPLPDGSPPDMDGTVLVVFRGAEHCRWGSASFMHIHWPVGIPSDDWRQYVRDPEGLFDDGALHIGYLDDTTLPPDATDTGYHRGPWHLWVSPSQAADAIYLANTDTGEVERWGRATPPILCD